MPAPELISIAIEGPERYIAVDSAGRVWQGKMVSGPRNAYIKWEQVEQEFPRGAH